MREITVGTNEAEQRLSKLLHKILRNAGDGFLYKMLRKKNIVLNGHKASGKEHLREGDVVRLYLSEETFAQMAGETIDQEKKEEALALSPYIIYEDADLLLLNKPAGWLSQGDGSQTPSVNERCIAYLREKGELSSGQLGTFRPGIANRLDRNTSGLILFGKTLPALQSLSALLRAHRLEKSYLAAVAGIFPKKQRIKGYLQKDGRRNQVRIEKEAFPGAVMIDTEFIPLRMDIRAKKEGRVSLPPIPTAKEGHRQKAHPYSLLYVNLYTGRTHQIRAQLAAMHHPILGDPKYGNPAENRYWAKAYGIHRQMLHAYKLHFPNDIEGVLHALSGRSFYAPPPADNGFSGLLPPDLLLSLFKDMSL